MAVRAGVEHGWINPEATVGYFRFRRQGVDAAGGLMVGITYDAAGGRHGHTPAGAGGWAIALPGVVRASAGVGTAGAPSPAGDRGSLVQ